MLRRRPRVTDSEAVASRLRWARTMLGYSIRLEGDWPVEAATDGRLDADKLDAYLGALSPAELRRLATGRSGQCARMVIDTLDELDRAA